MKWICASLFFILTSCKKEHVCECRLVRDIGGSAAISPEKKHVFKGSLPSAEVSCIALEGSGSDEKGHYIRDCEIRQ